MSLAITPVYAALLTLMFVFLSFRVIGLRRAEKIGLGDGGNRDMLRRIRAHGNFAEYCPLALLLMALAELQNQPDWRIHLIGGLLVAGRVSHAYGVSNGAGTPRVAGMILTFAALITGALANLSIPAITSLFAN